MSTPGASSSDAASVDAILRAMYEVLCGAAGAPRDWTRFRSLYLPNARLMPVVSIPGETPRVRALNPDDYIRRVEPIFARENFWERETGRQAETFGRVAHVLSHYESLRAPNAEPFERGSNSVQLFYDDSRWWIVSVMWNTSRGG